MAETCRGVDIYGLFIILYNYVHMLVCINDAVTFSFKFALHTVRTEQVRILFFGINHQHSSSCSHVQSGTILYILRELEYRTSLDNTLYQSEHQNYMIP
jgi:hypothetical protein